MSPVARRTLCPALLLVLLAAAGSAAAQDAAPPPDAGAPAAPAPQDTKPPDGFRVGDFTFKPGGRIKLDGIRDFTRVGNEDSFDTRTIRIDDINDGGNSNVHAKETRLSLDIRGKVDEHELRMYVETDFYGSGTALRLRHAYGSYKWLLAGQTWSTFMDDDNFPRTIDFESPTAFAMVRQAQLRVTHKFGRTTWSAAIEDNKSTVEFPSTVAGEPEFPMPDLVTRFRFDMPAGHISTAAFVGAARFRPLNAEDAETATLWGSMLSANFATTGRDSIYGVVTFGDGIGRYRGGTAAVLDENRDLHAVRVLAFMGGYEHFWAERWSSNAVYSIAKTDDQPFYADDFNRRLDYGAVNFLYWFVRDLGWIGVEYLYGRREIFAGTPNSGTAHRVQYAVRFNLP